MRNTRADKDVRAPTLRSNSMKSQNSNPWHSRGYLPHFDSGEILQSITFHLGDAMPKSVITRWKGELVQLEEKDAQIELYERVEKYLDKGHGECFLQNRLIAPMVQNALLYFDGERYKLIAWVIMPNHIHILLKPKADNSLSDIVHSIKSFTAQKANKMLNRRGKFWQEDYFDRYIRDSKALCECFKLYRK